LNRSPDDTVDVIVRTGSIATFDEQALSDGLQLSLFGMGLVFIVLSILAVAIKIVEKVESMMPGDSLASAPAAPPRREPASAVAKKVERNPGDAEIAAAIAVSLALTEQPLTSAAAITAPRERTSTESSWIAAGRARAMAGRIVGAPAKGRPNR
jgi:sodium pump decarboxylase gamma subunit